MLLTLIFPHDDVFTAVKQESSLHSVRQSDKDGNSIFESLVFDEAYLTKFQELFRNAQAQATSILSAYATGREDFYYDRKDFSENRDFICHLDMPDDFNELVAKSIEDYVFSFLKDWIMYKWLETKMPDTAVVFLANCKNYRESIKSALYSRCRPRRRHHQLY